MVLGEGAIGKVYLAKLQGTQTLFAIKAMKKHKIVEKKWVDRTALESEILFSNNHPFICGIDYVFQNDSRLYFAMPFIRGGELYKIIEQGQLSEAEVKFYAAQLVVAIGHLHSRDIVHRDLKLENILIDEKGNMQIIDFGLAKVLKEKDATFTVAGTQTYMAPEILNKTGHNKSVDWWALGVIVYALANRSFPFSGPASIKNGELKFANKSLSKDLRNLINGLLIKD